MKSESQTQSELDKQKLQHAIKCNAIPMDISVAKLIFWVIPAPTIVAIAGIYPTWLVAKSAGVISLIVAYFVVTGVMIATGALVAKAGKKGESSASMTFIASSWLRIFACPGLGALGWLLFDVQIKPLGIWMVIFYTTTLAMEIVWMVRALNQHNKIHKSEFAPIEDDKNSGDS